MLLKIAIYTCSCTVYMHGTRLQPAMRYGIDLKPSVLQKTKIIYKINVSIA